jgi:predicted amidophosphoribosyltransferase
MTVKCRFHCACEFNASYKERVRYILHYLSLHMRYFCISKYSEITQFGITIAMNLGALDDINSVVGHGRSQWPRGLCHELSSAARTLDRGFEYHSTYGCLRLYYVCVVLCR